MSLWYVLPWMVRYSRMLLEREAVLLSASLKAESPSNCSLSSSSICRRRRRRRRRRQQQGQLATAMHLDAARGRPQARGRRGDWGGRTEHTGAQCDAGRIPGVSVSWVWSVLLLLDEVRGCWDCCACWCCGCLDSVPAAAAAPFWEDTPMLANELSYIERPAVTRVVIENFQNRRKS